MRLKPVYALLLLSALMVSCASNKNKQNSEDQSSDQPARQVPVAVGTIQVKLMLTSVDTSNNRMTAEITEVVGYGAGTQPLTLGSSVTLSVPSSMESAYRLSEKKEGWNFIAVIAQQRQMGNSNTPVLWDLVEIKTN